MPNKSRKRNYRRRRKRRGYTVSQNTNIVPQRQIVKLTYIQRVLFDPALGASVVNIFSANGMYDPDVSGVGGQPLGFDQWMPFYNHYVVLGSKCDVSFNPVGEGGTNGNFIAFLQVKADTTSQPTDVERNLEYQHTVYKVGGSAQANNGTKLSMKMSTKRFLGRSNPLSDPDLKGTSTSNPSESSYFHVGVAPINSGYDLGAVTALVRINYIAALLEPKLLPSS